MRRVATLIAWHFLLLAAGWAGLCLAAILVGATVPAIGSKVFVVYACGFTVLRPLFWWVFPAKDAEAKKSAERTAAKSAL